MRRRLLNDSCQLMGIPFGGICKGFKRDEKSDNEVLDFMKEKFAKLMMELVLSEGVECNTSITLGKDFGVTFAADFKCKSYTEHYSSTFTDKGQVDEVINDFKHKVQRYNALSMYLLEK